MKKTNKESESGGEINESETECEEEMFESRKVRGFKKGIEENREKRIQNGKSRDMKQERKRFCHFWNNGRCRYRDKECRFLHEESPECRYGKECNM